MNKLLYSSLVVSLFAASSAHAFIIMSVDSLTETLSFSGSDSGTMATVDLGGGMFVGEVVWDITGSPVDVFGSLDLSAAFTQTPSYPSTFELQIQPTGNFLLSYFAFSVTDPALMIGTTSSTIDYSALSDSQKSALQGISGSFGLSKGAFSNLEVNQVPEPAAAALLLGLATVSLICGRRSKRT